MARNLRGEPGSDTESSLLFRPQVRSDVSRSIAITMQEIVHTIVHVIALVEYITGVTEP